MNVAQRLPGAFAGRRPMTLLITAAMFADAVFYALIAPLLPHYSEQLSLDHLQVGLLVGAHPAGTVACAAIAARLVRGRGAAITITLGLISLGLATIVFGVANSLPLLAACRFVQGASAAMVWCGGLARLQAIAPPERQGAALGLAGSAAGAGSLFGPALAALSVVISIQALLLTLGALTLLLAATLYSAGELPGERRFEEPGGRPSRSLAQAAAEMARPVGVIVACGAVLGATATLAPLRLADLGAGLVLIAAAFALSALGEIFASPFAGHISDQVGRMPPMRLSLVLAIPLLAIQGATDSAWLMIVAVALTGAVIASLWPLATALLADESSRWEGSAAGVFATSVVAFSSGLAAGSVLCGALAGSAGEGAAYSALVLVCVISLASLMGAKPLPRYKSRLS